MARASDLFYASLAIDDIAESKNLKISPTAYTDNFADIIVTPLYMYQSVPQVTSSGTFLKYIQLIRSEVLDNAHVLGNMAMLDTMGYAWTWGVNISGQLGDNTTTDSYIPVSVVGNRRFNQITTDGSALNDSLACAALDYDGYGWSWGSNAGGRLGDNTMTGRSSPASIVGTRQFVSLTANPTISAGSAGFRALDISGFAWAWGFNNNGDLGDNTVISRSSPVSVVGGLNFVAIDGNIAIDTNNNCWAWGPNTYGQLGNNTTTNTSSPIGVLEIANVIQVASGGNHNLLLTSDGYCWAVGNNAYGELGNNTIDNKSLPTSIAKRKFIQICAGVDSLDEGSSFGLDDNGMIWAWGSNKFGQLGDGTTTHRSVPVSVRQGTRKMVQLNYNYGTTTAIDMDGNVWSWGRIIWAESTVEHPTTNCSNPVMLPSNLKGLVKKY